MALIDLEALALYLDSDRSPDDCMGLSNLDGFLTGVIIGPELILPSEWLPVIWGDGEPEFESDAEMRTVIGTIMGRYNEIATCFGSDPYQFEPLFLEGPNGVVIASDWVGGFLDAVALRPKAWKPLNRHRRDGILLAPLLTLGSTEHHAGRVGAANEEKLSTEMPDIIHTCVLGIHEFWKNYRGRPKSAPRRARRPNAKT
jgi:uncharacterized protein